MKRILSFLLALCICLTSIPFVFAEETASVPAVESAEPFEDAYVQGSVLFALKNAQTLTALADTLAALGITDIEPLFTENGEAVGIGS